MPQQLPSVANAVARTCDGRNGKSLSSIIGCFVILIGLAETGLPEFFQIELLWRQSVFASVSMLKTVPEQPFFINGID